MITYYTKEGKFETLSIRKLSNNTIFHREGGPAIIFSSGTKKWFKNGKRHRLDGPAIVWHNGYKEWYINGGKLDTEEVETWIKNNNINLKTKQHQVLFMVMFG